jgi:hypothetical protein
MNSTLHHPSDQERVALALRLADGSATAEERDYLHSISSRRAVVVGRTVVGVLAVVVLFIAVWWGLLLRGEDRPHWTGFTVITVALLMAVGTVVLLRRYASVSMVEPGSGSPAGNGVVAVTRQAQSTGLPERLEHLEQATRSTSDGRTVGAPTGCRELRSAASCGSVLRETGCRAPSGHRTRGEVPVLGRAHDTGDECSAG